MFIRYQIVRNTTLGLGTAGIITAIALAPAAENPDPGPIPVAPLAAQHGHTNTPSAAVTGDAAIIAAASNRIVGGKTKDALGGRSAVKVNVYDDDGDGIADRLKVDRNRDENWDESWTFKRGVWQREDGKVWRGAWVDKNAPTAAPGEATGGNTGTAADPIAAARLNAAKALLEGRATSDKEKDLTRGRGPKFNLYDDDGDGRWDRAKADYDRDDVWDENWTVKGGVVERKDLKSNEVMWLEGTEWRKK